MGMFMSSFEFSSSMNIDTNRSTSSQLKQHYFGFGRFLKRQALHFARFGFFIGLIEIPIELVVGRVNALGVFVSGGLAACLQNRYTGFAPFLSTFLGSGCFIGGLGLYMHKGEDKAENLDPVPERRLKTPLL